MILSSNASNSERKDLQKRYKETPIDSARERRDRERQKQRELRRERKRERQAKRTNKAENKEINDPVVSGDNVDAGPSSVVAEKKEIYVDEGASGCNSEDEYDSRRPLTLASPTAEEWARVDILFMLT